MNADRWARIRATFESAIELPEEERMAFLAESVGSDAELRGAVERMLVAEGSSDGYLEPPTPATFEAAGAAPRRAQEPARPGKRLGRYEIVRPIASGGMGTVYEAVQDHPQRTVALKVARFGLASAEAERRFRYECEVLGKLQHPAIAQIYEAGVAREDGEEIPFFAMELLEEAVPITRYVRERELTIADRIELFLRACEGVHHGHQRGIIHRDLKPGNLIVSVEGQPKVIDFGIARAVEAEERGSLALTSDGDLVGTLEYMSPEQIEGDPMDLDVRTDVYSLGVVLYELLTGEFPFELSGKSMPEVGRIICEVEPPRPSTRKADLPRELDWIVLRAMSKERERRYGTVEELIDDLRRFCSFLPLRAGPPSTGYYVRKFVRRHRLAVALLTMVLVTLLAGGIGTAMFAVRAEHNYGVAQTKIDEFDMLANVVRLKKAIAAEAELYPAWPERIEAMTAWMNDHIGPLRGALPELRKTRRHLEQRTRRSESEQFLLGALGSLIADIEALQKNEVTGVEERLDWARRLGALSIQDHATRWEEARDALRRADGIVASQLYRSDPPLDLKPQIGFVPIGMNPRSKLWEFVHLRSSADPTVLPRHEADGSILVGDTTGIVFVLIPGGRFVMGAQRERRDEANFDRTASAYEGPICEVSLSPYFLSRYEMTQRQWERLSGGERNSHHQIGKRYGGQPGPIVGWHPVDTVSWLDADALLREQGLTLPTEARWEYACRAGTSSPWSSGRTPESLEGYANVADETARVQTVRRHIDWQVESFDDGYYGPAPVGSFSPNAFGMHDMHGNLWEYCLDPKPLTKHRGYEFSVREGDGLRLLPDDLPSEFRPVRGGGFNAHSIGSRSSSRQYERLDGRLVRSGVRAAREVQ